MGVVERRARHHRQGCNDPTGDFLSSSCRVFFVLVGVQSFVLMRVGVPRGIVLECQLALRRGLCLTQPLQARMRIRVMSPYDAHVLDC